MFRNLYVVAFAVFLFESESLVLEVVRPSPPRIEDPDVFTNVGALGKCRSQNGKQLCQSKNADCAHGDNCCTCKCRYEYANLYMYSSDRFRYTCEKSEKVDQLAGCTGFGFYQITSSQPRLAVNLNQNGSKGVMKSQTTLPIRLKSFGVKGNAAFKDGWGKWKDVRRLSPQPVFHMVKIRDYPYYELQWNSSLGSSYNGRLMRVNLTWTKYGSSAEYGCVVFRVAGVLSYNLGPSSPSPSGILTSVLQTTALPVAHTVTIKVTTSRPTSHNNLGPSSPSPSTTFTSVLETTALPVAHTVTTKVATSFTKTEKTPARTTDNAKTTSLWEKTTSVNAKPSEQSSSQGTSSRKAPEDISSKLLVTSSAPPTEQIPTTPTESNREESRGGLGNDNVIIAIISAAAAIICVLIISLFACLIVRQRKRCSYANCGRNDGSCNGGVISNPAAPIQNNIPLPIIKNPMYDENEPVYSEAFDKHQRSLPKLPKQNRFDNPTYCYAKGDSSKISIKNTGASAREPSLKVQKNIYVVNDIYDNRECAPLYEGIANRGSDDYDNQPLYQSLNSAGPEQRASLYQPLLNKPVQSPAGSAEYLQSKDVMPEYLTIINPAAESISGEKEQNHKTSNTPQKAGTPLYDVLEELGPKNIESCGTAQATDEPDYGVLEGPEPTSAPRSVRKRPQQGSNQRSHNGGESFRI